MELLPARHSPGYTSPALRPTRDARMVLLRVLNRVDAETWSAFARLVGADARRAYEWASGTRTPAAWVWARCAALLLMSEDELDAAHEAARRGELWPDYGRTPLYTGRGQS